MKKIALFADLVKYKLSLAVTMSAVTGYFISGSGLRGSFILVVAGIFLLTAGAAALNQFTEKDLDVIMLRTRKRPLPSGRIKPGFALFFALCLISAGLSVLSLTGIIPFVLGLFAVVLYNVIYTKLKRISLLSVLPGALVGALPPLIGYFSAGGLFPGNEIIMFSVFMFMWQLPHFWLILIRYRDDYSRAGFRTFREQITDISIQLLVLIWVVVTTSFLIFFSVEGLVFSRLINSILIILNLFFILFFCSILFGRDRNRSVRGAFILINSFSLLIMILFIVNSFIR